MSYNRYMASADIEDSALHKVKATYWEAKHKLMSKIGKNDDEHLQASDAELDAKIEILKSVQRTTDRLMRLVNEYEYCMFSLAKSEYGFSRFLKTQSEVDRTRAGKIMAAVGRVENFSSQQRLGFRQPLERLYQECETFRLRAVTDTSANLECMESARNDYRAALMWMKDVSEELDPDAFKHLDKFRKVQAQVRKKKALFDRLKLDVMQKVDMLAASRANMFSRALEFYQKWLMEYWAKNARTLEVVAKGFSGMYQYYEFNVIKDLAEPNKLMAEKTGCNVEDEHMQSVLQEIEATISELVRARDAQSIAPRLSQRDENCERDYRYYKDSFTPADQASDEGDDKQIDLLGINDEENGHGLSNGESADDDLILAEPETEKGTSKTSENKEKEQADLMSSDFFDIDKADGAMAELHKRQCERTLGTDADEQLLLSLAGPAPQSEEGSNKGGLGANEELKLLDELLSVMNQSEEGKEDTSGLDVMADLSLNTNWNTSDTTPGKGPTGTSELDFLRPAEASSLGAMMPSQLLELKTGHSSQLFSLPFGPFGTSRDENKPASASLFGSSKQSSSPFFVQEQQRSGLLLGPPSVGKVVSSEKPSLGDLSSGQQSSAGDKAAKEEHRFDLFADLDPFANPDAIGKKIQPSDADQI